MPIAAPYVPHPYSTHSGGSLPVGCAVAVLAIMVAIGIWSALWRHKQRREAEEAEELFRRRRAERNRRIRPSDEARLRGLRSSSSGDAPAAPGERRAPQDGDHPSGVNDAQRRRDRRLRWRR